MAATILIKRDTSINWFNNNPILRSGEFGLETDTRKIKIGNGQRWNSISKFISPTENTLESLLVNYVLSSEKGVVNGVASLDSSGKIPLSQLPDALSLDSEISAVASAAAVDATSKANAAQAAAEATAAGALSSAISTEVSNRNTAISTAVDSLVDGAPALLNTLNELAAAINDDANYTTTITTALGTKAPLASPALTGVPTAPTAAADTNTTQIATTAFAKAEADAAQAAAISVAATDATSRVAAESTLRVLGDAASVLNAAADATSKANAAQAAAETNAAADATSKANAAQAAAEAIAKDYTDEIATDLVNNIGDSLGDYIPLNKFGTPSGVATLDLNGILNLTQVPASIATKEYADTSSASAVSAVIGSAPAALNTLNELAQALSNDSNYATTVNNALSLKAPIANPTFTGTVSGITKSMVGLANVDNTTDLNKPVSSLTQTALDTKVNKLIETNAQPGSYSILASDAFKLIEMSGGGTLTIVDSVNFPTGTTIEVLQTTDSQVNIAGSGFTPNSTPGLKLRARWSSATLLKRGTNSWVVMGDLSA